MLFEVTFRLAGDNSWCLAAADRARERMQHLEATALPAVRPALGSGSGELVLTWIEVEADGAVAAAAILVPIAYTVVPDAGAVAQAVIQATAQDPDRERRRPIGA